MANRSILKEEIFEVFKIFDEDDSGVISVSEFCRALYCILGKRVARSEVESLISDAKQQRQAQERSACEGKSGVLPVEEEDANGKSTSGSLSRPDRSRSRAMSSGMTMVSTMQWQEEDETGSVTPDIFERVVLTKLSARCYAEELQTTFGLLEDKLYPGFITRESLVNAAAEIEEPLTEMEINEMFDPLVTGVPTAAVDFEAFSKIQTAARNMCDK